MSAFQLSRRTLLSASAAALSAPALIGRAQAATSLKVATSFPNDPKFSTARIWYDLFLPKLAEYTGGALTTLYSFGHSDGANPEAGLVQASDGNFYGTTYGGGADIRGTIFEITPSGLLTTVYSFSYPEAGLIQANDGNLYGTTYEGGAHNFGTVFKLALGQ